MSGVITLSERERGRLRKAIDGFDVRDRDRGWRYYRQGRVKALRLAEHGSVLEAEVVGSEPYSVTWTYAPAEGWTCDCTCPVGDQCKHAYAAALAVLSDDPISAEVPDNSAQPPSMAPVDTDQAALVQLLEERHGRRLTKSEHGFVRNLVRLWRQQRVGGLIHTRDLADVNLADRAAGLYYDPNPFVRDWPDGPIASPLEFWQYLACFAERANRPLPPLMKPVTDTAAARAQIEAAERRRLVEFWKDRFRDPAPTGTAAPGVATALAIPEVRLRLASPKLLWEFRPDEQSPWRAAKPAMVKQWFAAAAENPASASPATLALLQEAQLQRARRQTTYGWVSSREPQTLRLDDESTATLVRWLMAHPALRDRLVNEAGETYEPDAVELVWNARPSPRHPGDVAFSVTLPDGAPLPRGLTVLEGTPPLGLLDRRMFRFPPPLALQPDWTAFDVPREALASVTAVRHLRRLRVVLHEGVNLPEVELIALKPCFVCRVLADREPDRWRSGESLQVELQARSADGQIVQRRSDHTWVSLPGRGVGTREPATGVIRDLDREKAEAAVPLLARLRIAWSGPKFGWLRPITRNFPEEFASWAEDVRAAGVPIECDPLLAGLVRPPDRARVEMQVDPAGESASGIDWFDLQLVVRAEDASLTREEIELLLKARGRFVLLKGKGWRRLEIDVDAEQAARLGELGLDAEALGRDGERQRFHVLQLADERIAGLLPEQHAARVRERLASLRAIPPPAPPATLVGVLRPYQEEGFHFLAHLATNGLGGVLADDMGLGKTVQALAWLLWLAGSDRAESGARDGGARATTAGAGKRGRFRALVVCPKSVVTNWELETQRFAPSLAAAAFSPRDGVLPEAELVIVNYTQLRLAAELLGCVDWDAVILDEGQNIKNPQSQTAQVARNLRAAHRVVLTGTPIENRTLDLWSLFAFAMPGLLGSQAMFKRNFNDRTDPLARTRLARRVRHFMLRRTKAQVAADLPPRIEEDLVVELEPAQRKLYEAELKRARQMLLGAKTARQLEAMRFNILQSLLRLRQICCDPRLLGADRGESAKLGALLEQLEPILAEGHKVLVFSQFVSMLEILQEELASRNINYLTITGRTENRQELVDAFQTSDDTRVFLLSLKAAGSGLNLTAASYVVLFDPWWNPAVEAQAIDRTHRIGQTNQVIAYRLIAKDTVEEKIRQLQREKAALARAIVQEESLATVLDLEDLRYVLG